MTPTPVEIRAAFAEMLQRELIGPRGGEDEQIANGTVRESYLAGMLAPQATVGVDPSRSDDPGHLDGDDAVEDPDSASAAARPAMFPSSMGLTCVVSGDVRRIVVSGSWGRYERVSLEPDADGRKRRTWQRTAVTGSLVVDLVPGAVGPIEVAASEHPGVLLQGEVTRQGDAWLVSLFMVNAQESDKRDSTWLFQAGFEVTGTGDPVSNPVFVGRSQVLGSEAVQSSEPELAELDLLYRNRVEFAVGHGAAVQVDVSPTDPSRAYRIVTQSLPITEVPRTEAPSAVEEPALVSAVFDMRELSDLRGPALVLRLQPLVDVYRSWISVQRTRATTGVDGLGQHPVAAELNLERAEEMAARIQAGIDLLGVDDDAAASFRFANKAMWQQRIRTSAIEAARGSSLTVAELTEQLDVERNRSWRPFQLAFVLLNLPSLTDPTHAERRLDTGTADLLFFPTGGGKTEAYLGLTAFTLAIRRLQGDVAGHSGEGGVGVLMRYTLRLLTAQQFQRAATLICACEVRRRELVAGGDHRWGATPFRIGTSFLALLPRALIRSLSASSA